MLSEEWTLLVRYYILWVLDMTFKHFNVYKNLQVCKFHWICSDRKKASTILNAHDASQSVRNNLRRLDILVFISKIRFNLKTSENILNMLRKITLLN